MRRIRWKRIALYGRQDCPMTTKHYTHTHTHTHRQTSLPFPFTEEFEVPAKGFTAVSDRGTVELELELDPRFEGKG
jgi:beta-glucanase (GH16 family)